MRCKNCFHYEVCNYHIDEETDMTVNECGRFAGGERFYSLPCKPGDIIYFLEFDRFDYAEVEEIHIRPDGVFFAWVQYDRGPEETEVWDDGEVSLEDFGKTVFSSREDRDRREKLK